MVKSEKLIIVGKSGAGKNYLYEKLKKSLPNGIKYTTRKPRENDIDNYYYLTNEEYTTSLNDNLFITQQTVSTKNGDIHYGLTFEEFDKKQLFILSPQEINKLDLKTRKKCFIVYLNIETEIRKKRLVFENLEALENRLLQEEIDFSLFKNYDLQLNDPEFDIDLILSLMF